MNLEVIWEEFVHLLSKEKEVQQCHYQKVAGIPFLYVTVNENFVEKDLNKLIRSNAGKVMKGKQLHSETIYVRSDYPLFVYRHLFYVPQEKMFCCGNLCTNCIRLRK
ncbi:hypothetical protein SM124_02795 [Bacillus sp. 31A1R]|uniref:Uncharacterized protein n=1 Tax=Robertmurraya mangrovi TaxID=3098077 RepID=A0ABU5IU80_9BACI|nr:hypothetical protein [Bacillus sp. 31A1R]MDZ5470671.1 hypothetical protein [Bacillus sp. 31A1R]